MAGKEDLYVGKRLSFDGALCTIRYHGPLAGTKGSWLGVEWDDTSRGRHDGTHQSQRIFSCLSTSKTAGSFVRPTRPSDRPRTFLEALRFKYAGKVNANELEQPVEISGKTVEEVGFEKIRRQQAELQDLRVAVLDELQMCGVNRGHRIPESVHRVQDEIAETCPNIIELDLGWSLLETWQDVADICQPLKKLRTLKVR
jgi:tubulin-specific chaperone E